MLTLDNLVTLISSILGAAIAGYFTFKCVKATLMDNWRKEIELRNKEFKQKILQINQTKPEFDTTNENQNSKLLNVFFYPIIDFVSSSNDFRANYPKLKHNEKELDKIVISLKNTGMTDIEEFVFYVDDYKHIGIFDFEHKDKDIENGYINYSILEEKKIKTQDYLQLNFFTDKINNGFIRSFYIYYKSTDGYYWRQEFLIKDVNNLDIKTKTPKMVSPYEYSDVISNRYIINYIRKKCYFHYDGDIRFKYIGEKNFLIEEELNETLKYNDDLLDKNMKFNEKFNFKEIDLYD